MGRPYDPAKAIRDRLKAMEQRQQARGEAEAVAEGVAETVALAAERGTAFEKRDGLYQRQPGLDFLARKGRLSVAQKAAGERYGACYRRAMASAMIGSTLEVQPGMSAAGPPLSALLAQAEGRRQAELKLAMYRRQLLGQADLIAACDRVCGRELTPREAAGGEREASRLEAVLLVALDILAAP
jgi:hypothetical protein